MGNQDDAGNTAIGDGNGAPANETEEQPISFDSVLAKVEADNAKAAKGDDDGKGKIDNQDDTDDDSDPDKSKAADEDTGNEDEEEEDESTKPKEGDAADKAAEEAKKKGEDEDDDSKEGRPGRYKQYKEKAEQLDALETEYADIGGLEGLRDFAGLIAAYRDPAKIDDFIGHIGELPEAHRSKIVSKLFYDALDVPENKVEAINDALLALSETTSIKITEKELIQTPEELDKIIKYIGFMLEDDRDDLFETIDTRLAKVENLTPREREMAKKLAASESAKGKEHDDDTNPMTYIDQAITSFADIATKTLADKDTVADFETRGLVPVKGDTDDLKAAKEELMELVRMGAVRRVGESDLGKEFFGSVNEVVKAGDKPSAVIKNLSSRFKRGLSTNAKNSLAKIGPLFRHLAKKKDGDPVDQEKGDKGSEQIITDPKKKGDAIETDDTSGNSKDYRNVADPFDAKLKEVKKTL